MVSTLSANRGFFVVLHGRSQHSVQNRVGEVLYSIKTKTLNRANSLQQRGYFHPFTTNRLHAKLSFRLVAFDIESGTKRNQQNVLHRIISYF